MDDVGLPPTLHFILSFVVPEDMSRNGPSYVVPEANNRDQRAPEGNAMTIEGLKP